MSSQTRNRGVASEAATPVPPRVIEMPLWRTGACSTCETVDLVVEVSGADRVLQQCAMCLYRAVIRESNRQQVASGVATVLPTPLGGQALLPCERCPPGSPRISWPRPCTVKATGETVWLCDEHNGLGRPVPRTS